MQSGKHKKPRLGAGLSLDKFSKAKKSTYDPRVVKEKERALNAKKVNKYKKLKERLKDKLQPRVDLDAVDGADDDVEEAPRRRFSDAREHAPHEEKPEASQHRGGRREINGDGQRKGKKPLSHLQRVAAKAEEEQKMREMVREQQRRQEEERRARLDADAARRKQQNRQFRKKTHSGQPLMKESPWRPMLARAHRKLARPGTMFAAVALQARRLPSTLGYSAGDEEMKEEGAGAEMAAFPAPLESEAAVSMSVQEHEEPAGNDAREGREAQPEQPEDSDLS